MIDNIAVIDMSAHAISLSEGARFNKIQNNFCENIGMFAITIFSDGHHNIITNNVIENSSYGIVVDDATTGGESRPSDNNSILNNVVLNSGMAIVVEGSNHNLVKDNYIYGSNFGLTGIDVWPGGYDGVSRPMGNGNVITGNKIIVKSQYGIRHIGKESIIEDNVIIGPKYDGVFIRSIKDWDPETLDVNKNISIKNNKIFQVGRWGVRVEDCDTCQVVGNIFFDSAQAQESISLYPMYGSGILNSIFEGDGKGAIVLNGNPNKYQNNTFIKQGSF
jgi:parallel beta-helix repeat protein